jgi:hypothetical protein
MEVDIRSAKPGILRCGESIIPGIFVQPAGHIVEIVEEVGIMDMNLVRPDANNGSC